MAPVLSAPRLPPQAPPILRWIGEGGLASESQLARRFWPQAQPRTAYKYLHALVRAGYLLTAGHTVLRRLQDLYVLTALGSQALASSPPFVRLGWPHPQEWAPAELLREWFPTVTAEVLRQWKKRGHVETVGRHGVTLYRVTDVQGRMEARSA